MQSSEAIAVLSCPTSAQLHAFDRGLLTSPEIDCISSHLEDGCDQCSSILDSLSQNDEFAMSLRSANAPVLPPLITDSRYRIVSEIGRGGMGIVFQAVDAPTHRTIALKQLIGDLATTPVGIARFQQEVQTLARIEHPNVVRLYDSNLSDATPYLVMEFVDGESLSKRLNGKPLAPSEAATIMQKVASAVHAVHTADVLHRDLKPGNILLTRAGEPKVSDFGLARPVGDSEARLTRTGAILGTPEYMPPEQAQGEWSALTPATDVYSLGATFYEMLTGRPPFRGPNALSVLDQVIRAEPLAPSKLQPSIPKDLQTICLKCLEKSPNARYQTAAALAEDLNRWQLGQPILARPAGPSERILKWTRRNPTVATLLAAVAIVLIAGTVVSSVFAVQASRRAHDAQKSEERATRTAEDEKRSREEAERNAYNLTIRDADREWLEGRADKAVSLLQTCPPSMRGWEWNYLVHRCREKESLRLPDPEVGNAMEVTSDGKRVRYFSLDGTIREVDLATAKQTAEPLRVCGPEPRAIVFDRGARLCAIVHPVKKEIEVWNLEERRVITSITHTFASFLLVSMSPDGSLLAVGDINKLKLSVWECQSGKHICNLFPKNESDLGPGDKSFTRISSLAFSKDSQRLAVGTRDRVTIWDVRGKVEPISLHRGYYQLGSGELHAISNVAFVGPDDSQLISTGSIDPRVSSRAEIIRHELKPGKSSSVLANDLHFYDPFKSSQDGKRIAYMNSRNVVVVRDVASGKEIARFRLVGYRTHLIFTPDGESLLVGTDRGLEKWNINEEAGGEVYGTKNGNPVIGLAATQDGRMVAFTSNGGESDPDGVGLTIWNREHQKPFGVLPLKINGLSPSDLAFSRDGKFLAATIPQRRGVQVWNWQQKKLAYKLSGIDSDIVRVRFTPNGTVVGAARDGRLLEWNLDLPELPRLLYQHSGEIFGIDVSLDGLLVAVTGGERPKNLAVVAIQTGEVQRSIDTETRAATSVALRPNGLQIACGTLYPSNLQLFDLETRQRHARAADPHNALTPFTLFTADGLRIITGSHDSSDNVKVWDADRLTELLVLRGHKAAVNRGVMLPNGLLFTSSWDGTVRMWDGRPVK